MLPYVHELKGRTNHCIALFLRQSVFNFGKRLTQKAVWICENIPTANDITQMRATFEFGIATRWRPDYMQPVWPTKPTDFVSNGFCLLKKILMDGFIQSCNPQSRNQFSDDKQSPLYRQLVHEIHCYVHESTIAHLKKSENELYLNEK